MSGPFLKIVRVLLCALTLTLFGVGSPALRAEAVAVREAGDWGSNKRGKPVLASTIRSGAICPLVVAVQAGGTRVILSAARLIRPAQAGGGQAVSWRVAARDPERQFRSRESAGVVRLLI